MPRYNHTANFNKNKIYFFGGETYKNSSIISRNTLNDLQILDLGRPTFFYNLIFLEKMEWKKPVYSP